ncbi:multidrug efflux RND transporter outer membrane channel subunit OprM [Ramlibacter monticola]|uniref:Efflux transporter outer membrane subunit n=1 Tax=Ramlibacter monticola TaxID=1926872 RepID=A0A936Z3Z6_9BURK|nr:efflux transporter outer membrane subunit [Ramlibacter monticola]MBL0394509.1 efflux transporter outer membrane subunit [Ramlibacter monticola]
MKKLSALTAALVLAGCSQMPQYERPAAPVPGAFPYPSAQEGTPAIDLRWEQYFTDARLRSLIASALRNNRDLRIAVLNIAQARAQYDIRNADKYPTVAFNASAARQPSFINNAPQQTTLYQANLAFSAWELDFFGRIASLSESALQQFLATEEGRNAAQMSLVANVAATWLNLAADEELLALTEQTLQTRAQSMDLMKLRFEQGVSSEIDFRLAQSLYETARASLAQFQRQRAIDLNTLALLVGEPMDPRFEVQVTTASVDLPDVPAGLPSEVLVRRPDVQQAEHLLMSANADIGAARAAFFPRITLTAGVGTASADLGGLFKGSAWGYTVIPSLAQTVFDAGRNRANLAATEVSRDIAVAQYERAIQQAFREVADALAGRATYSEQVRAQAAVVDAESVRFRLAGLRYQNGVASTLDLLDAQRSLFSAQQDLVRVRLGRLQNQVQLYRSLGGGWNP